MYVYLFMNEALQKKKSRFHNFKMKEEKKRISRFYNKYSMSTE